jgi:hypothetical protein
MYVQALINVFIIQVTIYHQNTKFIVIFLGKKYKILKKKKEIFNATNILFGRPKAAPN